jgi:hypothetical protein
MPEDRSARRQGRLLQRALLSALLLAALGTGAVFALVPGNTSAPGDDEMDRAFAVQVVAMTDEISSLLKAWSAAAVPDATSADNLNLRAVGANLSARSRSWYDTLGAMPVSARLADAKQSMLLGLLEFESSGSATVQAMDLSLAGNEAAAVPLILEAANHAQKGADYFATAQKQFPSQGGSPAAPGTRSSTRTWGKRYAVGNPGSYLGARSGGNATAPPAGRPVAVGRTGTVLKPGARSYGIAPPGGSFVRWYPGARWAAGLR